jgi:hypothetical protein
MHYEVESDRQCAGSCSGETHRVIRVNGKLRTVVAIFRRRDMAEDLCGQFNRPRGITRRTVRELVAA